MYLKSATIFSENLDDGSYDNCSNLLNFSFAANVDLNSLTFTCADEGDNAVQLFITDENGNQNSCLTNVIVQDVLDILDCTTLGIETMADLLNRPNFFSYC